MKEKSMFGVRLNEELAKWVNDKATQNRCPISEIIYNAIILAKRLDEVPEDMRFSELLHIQGAKAAIMTHRLLERFIQDTEGDPNEIISAASSSARKQFSEWKL